jgi:hypothetical protein
LLYGSLIAFVLFAFLHNVFEAFAHSAATSGVLQGLLQGIAVGAFFLALLVCPAAFFVGAVRLLALFIRDRLVGRGRIAKRQK